MEKIKTMRMFLGCLAMGVAFIVVEIILEGLVNAVFKLNEKDVLIELYPNITLSGTRYHIINFLYLFAFCFLVIWVYALIRTRFGPGAKTALIAGIIFLIANYLFMINNINMGIFPLKPCLFSAGFSLVEVLVSAVVGAKVYEL